jgi:ferricrocin synthase
MWSNVELEVRHVFAALSGVDESCIGKNTTMHRLGLDSLNAAQIASQLRSKHFAIQAADVIERMTPAGIAAGLDSIGPVQEQYSAAAYFRDFDAMKREVVMRLADLRDKDIQSIRPCSSSQNGMLSQSLRSADRLYINHTTYVVPDQVSIDSIIRAWHIVQRKHHALRTIYCAIRDALTPFAAVVITADNCDVKFTVHEEEVDTRAAESEAADAIQNDLHRPPWHITVLKQNGQRLMMLSIHHALYDAQGLQYLLQDLYAATEGTDIGAEISTDSLLLSTWQGDERDSSEAKAFWQRALADRR